MTPSPSSGVIARIVRETDDQPRSNATSLVRRDGSVTRTQQYVNATIGVEYRELTDEIEATTKKLSEMTEARRYLERVAQASGLVLS